MADVVIVCGAGYVSGKEIISLELGEGLRNLGFGVEFAISSWNDSAFSRELVARDLRFQQFRLGFISATVSLDALRMTLVQVMRWPELLWTFQSFLRRAHPRKIIHTNWHHLLLLWPFLRPTRDVFWLHEIIPDKPQYRRFFRALAPRIGCFIPVSEAVGKSLQIIGISAAKICVVRNGIADPSRSGDAKRRTNHGLVIGIVGQVGRWKGHDDLLNAFSKIASEFELAELHVFGRGQPAYEHELKRRAAALGLQRRTFWHGFLAAREQIYGMIDICVVPSRFEEPFGLVAVEAAMFGIPVIAARSGGLVEIVQDGLTGLLVDAAKPQHLAAKLSILLSDRKLRDELGLNARTRALRVFAKERFITEFVHVLNGTSSVR